MHLVEARLLDHQFLHHYQEFVAFYSSVLDFLAFIYQLILAFDPGG